MRYDHVKYRVDQQLSQSALLLKSFDNLHAARMITRQRVEIRIKAIKEQWEEFHVSHKALTLAVSRLNSDEQQKVSELAYFSNDIYAATRECFLEIVAKMSTLLDDMKDDSVRRSPARSIYQSATVTAMCQVPRLPRIDLPKFNGTLSDWLPFRDLFTSLVICNSSITAVEKLQYLKTSLTGSASHLLKNTALTTENFPIAWECLTSFYENERLLVNSALQSLFSIKRMTRESSTEMEHLYTSIMQVYRTLETLHRPVQFWDDLLVFLIVQRLDSESVKVWEHHLGPSKKPPTWNQLREFLMSRLLSFQAFEHSQSGKSFARNHPQTAKSHSAIAKPFERQNSSCLLCRDKHYLAYCPRYQQKSVKQRTEFISSKRLCFNCLGAHRVANCQSTRRCTKCGKRHHSTLHQPFTSNEKTISTEVHPSLSSSAAIVSNSLSSTTTEITKTVHHAQSKSFNTNSVVLLATAKAKVVNQYKEVFPVRILLDQGSEVSLITERLAQQLRNPRTAAQIKLIGVGNQCNEKTRGIVRLIMRPYFDSPTEIPITAHILPKLTSILPTGPVSQSSWPHLQTLQLADPHFTQPGTIDIIIGADVYGQILENSVIKGPPGSPTAQLTKLGWIISGPTAAQQFGQISRICHCSLEPDLSELLEKFWHQEEIPSSIKNSLTALDQSCEDHFIMTHFRDLSGRYIVRLPFKTSPEKLGKSMPAACRMLDHLGTKFRKDQTYFQAYSSFLKEYKDLNHMIEVPEDEAEPTGVFYLPHHGVIRNMSTTTKLRVVFNGSCSVVNGSTLNELLHAGPKLQSDIFDVLIWFRQFRYTYSCNVEKMYRQIQIHPDDQRFQRILWKDNGKLIRYQLNTVTYRLACAPYQALRAILQLINDEGSKFLLAVEVMTKGRYVDDIYGGADSIDEVQKQTDQVNQLCMAGGFPLRK